MVGIFFVSFHTVFKYLIYLHITCKPFKHDSIFVFLKLTKHS